MIDRATGQAIDEVAHIRQSIGDILTTPIGSRVERRPYGSIIPDLIDHPYNAANRLRIMSATVMAIQRWEPRVRITRVNVAATTSGRIEIDMDATRVRGQRKGDSALAIKVLV